MGITLHATSSYHGVMLLIHVLIQAEARAATVATVAALAVRTARAHPRTPPLSAGRTPGPVLTIYDTRNMTPSCGSRDAPKTLFGRA